MLSGIKFNKKGTEGGEDSTNNNSHIHQALKEELDKNTQNKHSNYALFLSIIEKWQKPKESESQQNQVSADNEDQARHEKQVADVQTLCEDALESFLKGNFSRMDRTLEKLDHIKTTNIRNFMN